MVDRQHRLRTDHDVSRVRSRGKSAAYGALVMRYLPNGLQPARNRYTVIAGKRVGNSVRRNRLKRITREALRGYHPYLQQGFDIALICRGTIEEMPNLTVAQETLQRILSRTPLVPRGTTLPTPGSPVTTAWTQEEPLDDASSECAEITLSESS